MQRFSSSHRIQHISKWNYEVSVVSELQISKLELRRWPLEFVISFSKVYIWDRGLATSFWDHAIKSLIRHMNFQYIFSQLWKVKIFCGNIHSLKSKSLFSRKVKTICCSIHSLLSNTYFRGTVMYVQLGASIWYFLKNLIRN